LIHHASLIYVNLADSGKNYRPKYACRTRSSRSSCL
jgi:hypothetical protein